MAKVKDAFGQFVGIFRKSGSDEPTPEEVAQKEAYAMNTFRCAIVVYGLLHLKYWESHL